MMENTISILYSTCEGCIDCPPVFCKEAGRPYGPVTLLKEGQIYTLIGQEHHAKKAGRHIDWRIGSPEIGLLSWSTRKDWPEPGKRIVWWEQPVHDWGYGSFEGKLESGYGAGDVKVIRKGQVLVTRVAPNHVEFVIADERHPQRFSLVKPEKFKERGWFLINRTPTTLPEGAEKVHFTNITVDKLKEMINEAREFIAQPKIDGASAILAFNKDGVELYSYRRAINGRPIVYTERVFRGRPRMQIPPELAGTTLRVEVYGRREEPATEIEPFGTSEVISPQTLGGLLNSALAKSIEEQKNRKIRLKVLLYDIIRRGKQKIDFDTIPYSQRKQYIEELRKYLPEDTFHTPEEAITPEDILNLWEKISKGQHPLTGEGIVIHPATGKPMKLKTFEEYDVYIVGFFPGTGKYKDSIGGFLYSYEPNGPVVGRIGTGFSDALRRDMAAHPEEYIGRVARVRAQGKYESGALRSPALIALHEDISQPISVKEAMIRLAQTLEEAISEVDKSPSPQQERAGNYRKGHFSVHGLDITIEKPKGTIRYGRNADGEAWSRPLTVHYGYIKQTRDADGSAIDVFIGDDPTVEKIFVVDQIHPITRVFDEHKVILGAHDITEAQAVYTQNAVEAHRSALAITELTPDQFLNWLKTGDMMKPICDQISNGFPLGKRAAEAIQGAEEPSADAFSDSWQNLQQLGLLFMYTVLQPMLNQFMKSQGRVFTGFTHDNLLAAQEQTRNLLAGLSAAAVSTEDINDLTEIVKNVYGMLGRKFDPAAEAQARKVIETGLALRPYLALAGINIPMSAASLAKSLAVSFNKYGLSPAEAAKLADQIAIRLKEKPEEFAGVPASELATFIPAMLSRGWIGFTDNPDEFIAQIKKPLVAIRAMQHLADKANLTDEEGNVITGDSLHSVMDAIDRLRMVGGRFGTWEGIAQQLFSRVLGHDSLSTVAKMYGPSPPDKLVNATKDAIVEQMVNTPTGKMIAITEMYGDINDPELNSLVERLMRSGTRADPQTVKSWAAVMRYKFGVGSDVLSDAMRLPGHVLRSALSPTGELMLCHSYTSQLDREVVSKLRNSKMSPQARASKLNEYLRGLGFDYARAGSTIQPIDVLDVFHPTKLQDAIELSRRTGQLISRAGEFSQPRSGIERFIAAARTSKSLKELAANLLGTPRSRFEEIGIKPSTDTESIFSDITEKIRTKPKLRTPTWKPTSLMKAPMTTLSPKVGMCVKWRAPSEYEYWVGVPDDAVRMLRYFYRKLEKSAQTDKPTTAESFLDNVQDAFRSTMNWYVKGQRLIGGPNPLTAMLFLGGVGAGLGYGIGKLLQLMLPDIFENDMPSRFALPIGFIAGAGYPAIMHAVPSLQEHGLKGLLIPTAIQKLEDSTPKKKDSASPSESIKSKTAAANSLLSQFDSDLFDHFADQNESVMFFKPDVRVDRWGNIIADDPYLTHPEKALIAGPPIIAGAVNNSKWVSPYDIAKVTANAGLGYLMGSTIGRVAGPILRLTPEARKNLQKLGVLAGIFKSIGLI